MTHTAKKSKLATILVGAALAGALAPTASAHHGAVAADEPIQVNPSTGYASVQPPAKDYSKNSVNGEYAPSKPSAVVTDYSKNSVNGQYLAPEPSSAAKPVVSDQPSDDGSDWSYAAIGAATGLGLLFVVVGVSSKNRRRQFRRHTVRA
jgi:hypothetical protein